MKKQVSDKKQPSVQCLTCRLARLMQREKKSQQMLEDAFKGIGYGID